MIIGVLALQGAFFEHVHMLKQVVAKRELNYQVQEVRTVAQLNQCDALVIPGGESTTMSLVAERSGLLEPLRQFVNNTDKPIWGTCAGLILVSDQANRTKRDGQELVGGLSIRINRNHFGRQNESFIEPMNLEFLEDKATPFDCVFIRAPAVDTILDSTNRSPPEGTICAPINIKAANARGPVQILAKTKRGDIVAVKQGRIFGTSFHPELTSDTRVHEYWVSTFC
ncbi:hypothetical protein CANCADRAFT_2039 [Tortispora caseinolytica NRRL Y-17796]|uniref:glutaminase n=1 Tax=Tortispora caseinolytica NRRL Y-17796 TaxID=767744 RepID=A0A1E4TF60_9ASCO|nr:hypothetical protein CANCADRAFT_2039 [Tortispora caseinolytica NRRL Y-17796]